jgi:hypothetical protein
MRLSTGAWIGALTSLPIIALSWLAERAAGLPFVPFHLFDWMARVLPGGVLTFGIDLLVGLIRGFDLGPTAATAKAVEQSLALLQFALIGLVFGLILAALGRTRPQRLVGCGPARRGDPGRSLPVGRDRIGAVPASWPWWPFGCCCSLWPGVRRWAGWCSKPGRLWPKPPSIRSPAGGSSPPWAGERSAFRSVPGAWPPLLGIGSAGAGRHGRPADP